MDQSKQSKVKWNYINLHYRVYIEFSLLQETEDFKVPTIYLFKLYMYLLKLYNFNVQNTLNTYGP